MLSRFAWLGVLWIAVASCGSAQSATGIVVNRQGEVFFADLGAGVWKLDTSGKLSLLESKARRSLAFDAEGMFANATHDQYQRVTPKGAAPALLAGGPFPIAVAEDNHLYYANSALNGHLQIMRLRPNGETFVVADIPDNPKEKKLRTVNAIAAGPGDAIYLAGNHTVRRVTQQGAVTAVAGPLNNPECAALPGIKKGWRPYLQGLAVDTGGTIYAAAAGCGAVFKIAPDGSVSTIHKIVAPWTPTGIALSKGEIYVLEYSYSTSKKSKEWLPRVEKIATDGSATVIATVKR